MQPAASTFLTTFALILCAAAVTTVVFHRLKQPVILGYLLAGLLVGPHIMTAMTADRATTETLAEVGVILLLFAIGLEFSVRRLLRVGGSVAITSVIDISLMAWLGIGVARMLGWTFREALFTGAMITASSTTIIAKTFEERGVDRKLRDQVMGVLVVEDLVAVLFLAGLGSLTGTTGASPSMFVTALRLLTLLIIWVTIGLVVVPRLIRRIVKAVRPETIVITSIGLCFAFALLARALGYSVALGAFIAGSLIAESGKGKQVAELVKPVRDVFAAVFFVAVGMLIDPALVAEHWGVVVLLTAVVIVGKVVSVSLGAFLAGRGTQAAVRTGLSMAQIGEFSFIIVSLGIATGAVREFLFPVAVAVSAITTLATPWLIGSSGPHHVVGRSQAAASAADVRHAVCQLARSTAPGTGAADARSAGARHGRLAGARRSTHGDRGDRRVSSLSGAGACAGHAHGTRGYRDRARRRGTRRRDAIRNGDGTHRARHRDGSGAHRTPEHRCR